MFLVVLLRWSGPTGAGTRAANNHHVATSSCDLPVITVQRAPLFAELIAPLVASIGAPINLQVIIENRTSRTETLSLAVGLSDDFAFSGLEETQCAVRAIFSSLHCRTSCYICASCVSC